MRLLVSGIAALVGAASLTACGTDGPTTLQSAGADVPPDTQRVTCEVRSDDGPVTLALDLPAGFHSDVSEAENRPACLWSMSVHVKNGTYSDAYDTEVEVAVYEVGTDDSLDAIYDEVEPDAVDEGEGTVDDSIVDLNLDEDVATYGDTVGDRLSYECICDGQNTLSRYAQAAGIRVGWFSVEDIEKQSDRQLEAALSTAGTIT